MPFAYCVWIRYFFLSGINCHECGSMYDGTNFMGIKGFEQCQVSYMSYPFP